MVGSDGKTLRHAVSRTGSTATTQVEAGQTLRLPRPNWMVKAGGPAGKNHLLAIVADAPRDFSRIGMTAGRAVLDDRGEQQRLAGHPARHLDFGERRVEGMRRTFVAAQSGAAAKVLERLRRGDDGARRGSVTRRPSFSPPTRRPAGFVYQADYLSAREESALLDEIARLPFEEARYRDYTARRRIVNFGPGRGEAGFLRPLIGRVADWLGVDAAELKQMLINEYRAGTPLGWHRDSPEYNLVAGVSLGAPCRMRLRPLSAAPRRAGAVARARAALRLPAVRRRALALAAQRPGDEGIALLDHLPYVGGMKWLLLLPAGAAPPAAQRQRSPNAILLVAKPELVDPNFRETVVLVTQAADASTVGVILNRPTRAQARQTGETLYFGGPVMREVMVALFRAERAPEAAAFHVLKGVYLTHASAKHRAAARAARGQLPPVRRVFRLGAGPARERDAARRLVRAAGERGVGISQGHRGNVAGIGEKSPRRVSRLR